MRRPRLGGVLERLLDRGLTEEQIRNVSFLFVVSGRDALLISSRGVAVSCSVGSGEKVGTDEALAVVSAGKASNFTFGTAEDSSFLCTPTSFVNPLMLLLPDSSSSAERSFSTLVAELMMLVYFTLIDHSSTALSPAAFLN